MEEPYWSSETFDDSQYVSEMIKAFNFYNGVIDDESARRFLVDWTTQFQPNFPLDCITNMPVDAVDYTLAKMARMHVNGFVLRPHHIRAISNYLETLEGVIKVRNKPPEANAQSRVDQKVNSFKERIHSYYPDAIPPKDLHEIMTDEKLKTPHLRIITTWMKERLPHIPRQVGYYQSFDEVYHHLFEKMEGLHRARQNYKWTDKVQESKFRMVEKDTLAKIREIPGASRVWIYNPKTKRLHWVTSKTGLKLRRPFIDGDEHFSVPYELAGDTELEFMKLRTSRKVDEYIAETFTPPTKHRGEQKNMLRTRPDFILVRVDT